MKHILTLDFETFSDRDIMKTGLYKYVQSPFFNILLTAYAIDDGPVKQIDNAKGEPFTEEFLDALKNPNFTKRAFNAPFEWYILCWVLKIQHPIEWLAQWEDTRIHALYCSYPASLDSVGEAIGLPQEDKKDRRGKDLIRFFCKPRKQTKNNHNFRNWPKDFPEKWDIFKEYNKQDVATERAIDYCLDPFPVPEKVWEDWRIDQAVNLRGTKVDLQLIEGALFCWKTVSEKMMERSREITGLPNPNSGAQLVKWLGKQIEDAPDNVRKATVSELLERPELPEQVSEVLKIRQQLGKTSIKKYRAAQDAACKDERVRGLLQYYGAPRTGRWAGRLVQIQNLPQVHLSGLPKAREYIKNKNLDALKLCYGNISDTLSQCIRTMFIPAKNCKFVVADFSAIEARVLAWEAKEKWRQDVFKNGGKIYEASAASMFNVPIESIHKGDPLRQRGKVAELALGYQGGVGAMAKMDRGHQIPENEMPGIVEKWRASSPKIVAFWGKMQRAAMDTVKTGKPHKVDDIVVFRIEQSYNTQNSKALTFLTMELPSKRKLFYARPKIVYTNKWGTASLEYWGTGQQTGKWVRLDTYGGKLTENATQAIARDCLAVSMERMTKAGFSICFHVHDEVITEVPAGKFKDPYEELVNIMREPIPWAPGLILDADGFVGDFYKKG